MTDVSVRPALGADAQAITTLQVCSLEAVAHAANTQVDAQALHPQVLAGWERTLNQPAPEGCFTLVALHGNRIVGLLCAIPGDAVDAPAGRIEAGSDVIAWHVDANFRRSGHASRLFAALARLATGTVRAWAGADDQASTRFLEACGFGPSGVQRSLDVGGHPLTQHLWFATLPE